MLVDLPPSVAASLKPGVDAGVYVNGVVDGAPAQKAGLLAGDILLKLDHVAMTAPEDVGNILVGKKPGDTVKVLFIRAGTTKSAYITLG